MKPYSIKLISILIIASLSAPTLHALGYRGEDGNLSMRLGALGSGTVEINNFEIEQKSAFSFGSSYDSPISDKLYWGVNVDFHRIEWEGLSSFGSNQRTMIDISAGFKLRLPILDGVIVLRPGIALGAGVLPSTSGLNNSRFLTVKATNELILYVGDQFGIFVEGGIFLAPNGRDEVDRIFIKPLPLFRIGISY